MNRLVAGTVTTVLLAGWSLPVAAQQPSSCSLSEHPTTTTFDGTATRLPVDRVADLLALSPGVSSLNAGELSVRGARLEANATYLDGVPVSPGWRGLASPSFGGSYYGDTGPGLVLGTNAVQSLTLTTGLFSPDLGNARGGIIAAETVPCSAPDAPRAFSIRGGLASDAMLGAGSGIGLNRITLNGDGQLGRLVLGAAVLVEGQRTARLGLEQNASPIYLADGIDTTVTFTDGAVDQTVDILRFRPSDGIRIPSSAATTYALSGRIGYFLNDRNRVELTGHASQRQQRAFSYEDLYNPRQTFGDRAWSEVLTGSWFGRLKESERLTLSAEAHLSLQWDHETNAPFTAKGESDTRDPATGIMLAPFDFRYDGSNFPVNEELVRNFRLNSGRLSPYDLTNATQYSLIDRYRNNAYGLTGFTEGGGPVGLLAIFQEKRVIGTGIVMAHLGSYHRVRAGFELGHYDTRLYSSGMTTQAFAEAYVESPSRSAAFGEYQLTYRELTPHRRAPLRSFQVRGQPPGFSSDLFRTGVRPGQPHRPVHRRPGTQPPQSEGGGGGAGQSQGAGVWWDHRIGADSRFRGGLQGNQH